MPDIKISCGAHIKNSLLTGRAPRPSWEWEGPKPARPAAPKRAASGAIQAKLIVPLWKKSIKVFFFSFNPPSPSKPRLGSRSPSPQLQIRRRSRTPCPGFITHFHLRNPSHFFPLRRTQQQLAGVDAKVNAFFFPPYASFMISFRRLDSSWLTSCGEGALVVGWRRVGAGEGVGGGWRD